MELHTLKKIKQGNGKKRLGRGIGSGKGGHTVGKGQKGQKSRSGKKPNLGFEGGQTPLYKRLPKIGGFSNVSSKETYTVKLDVFNTFKDGEEVTPTKLVEKKIIKKVPPGGVKILSDGELEKKIELKDFKFSKKAKEKIENSGSKIDA